MLKEVINALRTPCFLLAYLFEEQYEVIQIVAQSAEKIHVVMTLNDR